MSDPLIPGVGAVFSADIAVPSHERVKRFYSRVLTTGDAPLWRERDLLNNHGVPIIGLGERTGQYADLPVQWMPHIQVADVMTSIQQARDLGGSVLMDHKDGEGRSQWAVLADPNGTTFGIIPVVAPGALATSGGKTPDDSTPAGRIAWLDLTTPDAEPMRDFYRQVIGWAVQDVEMRDGETSYADYNMLGDGGKPAAGICHARGMNGGLPAVWMLYLPVGDLGESLRLVEEDGGQIIKAMKGRDGKHVYAAVQDPAGATVALVPG